jgi:hypothetical protein
MERVSIDEDVVEDRQLVYTRGLMPTSVSRQYLDSCDGNRRPTGPRDQGCSILRVRSFVQVVAVFGNKSGTLVSALFRLGQHIFELRVR